MRKKSVKYLFAAIILFSIFAAMYYMFGNSLKSTSSTIKKESDTVTYVDALGRNVELKKNPERVISLYNSYTEAWYLAGGTVIGRIESTTGLPSAALNAEVVGTMSTPNIEKIIALKPDLLLIRKDMGGQSEIISILDQNNIPYVAIEYESVKEYVDVMEFFTDLTGKKDLYKENGQDVLAQVESIVQKVPQDKKPSVLLMFGTSKGVTAKLPNYSVGMMLKDLGATNIAEGLSGVEGDTVTFSMESVIAKDPDYIFVITMGDVKKAKERISKDVEENPAWASLTAVKNKRYIYLPAELFLYKANDRYAEAYEYLANILYPDVFQ